MAVRTCWLAALLLLLQSPLALCADSQTCYWLNGSGSAPDHSPCFPNDPSKLGSWSVLESGQDQCLNSRLCFSQAFLYQGPCADSTFEQCAHFCPNGEFAPIVASSKSG